MAPRVTKKRPVKALAAVATKAPRVWTDAQKRTIVADALTRMDRGERLRGIAEVHSVSLGALHKWCTTLDGAGYAEARQSQADWHADESMRVLDALNPLDATSEEIAARKLKIETHKWFAEKLDPARFGARLQVDQRVTQLTVTLVQDGRVREVGQS